MQIALEFLSELPLFGTEKPYELFLHEIPAGLAKTNCEYTTHNNIPIIDARSVDNVFTLDDFGFSFLPATGYPAPTVEEFESVNAADVILSYLEATISFVSRHIEADRILCFDWRLRRNAPMPERPKDIAHDRVVALEAASAVHTDYSYGGGLSRLRRQLADEELQEHSLKQWRIRFVNIWRPLVPVVEDCPLALCDRRTVPKSDLVEADKIHHDHLEEGYYVKYNPAHQWYWLSGQRSDEVTMFVTWDSDHRAFEESSVSPHAAFNNPNARAGCRPRESMEVRLMLFNKR